MNGDDTPEPASVRQNSVSDDDIRKRDPPAPFFQDNGGRAYGLRGTRRHVDRQQPDLAQRNRLKMLTNRADVPAVYEDASTLDLVPCLLEVCVKAALGVGAVLDFAEHVVGEHLADTDSTVFSQDNGKIALTDADFPEVDAFSQSAAPLPLSSSMPGALMPVGPRHTGKLGLLGLAAAPRSQADDEPIV